MRGCATVFYMFYGLSAAATAVDERTGLIKDDAWQLVAAHCGNCHSLQLVTGNRGDRKTWLETIRWMQERQNLWQLDTHTEDQILTYLAKNYPAAAPRRRKPLAPHLLPKDSSKH
ncbi:MAG TPA: hypothetical protein DHU16_08165 [Gammaproteobacteria bacterium]|nr:hypothetical protein [Gammaproteobacteria bacterium]